MNNIVPINWSMLGWAFGLGIVVLIGMLAFMPALIRYLHKLKFGQTEREEGLASHKAKTGTPTMGGLAFLIVPFAVYFVCSFFTPLEWNNTTIIMWIAYLGYGLIGFIDDYIIVVQKSNEGLKPALKFGLQSVLAVILTIFYMMHNPTVIYLPGNIQWMVPIWFFVIVSFFLFTGSTNAVNLSDGVDGLCAGLSIVAFVPFTMAFLWEGDYSAASILILVIFALFGYLRFNIHPAKVFMGDTGSLALGGILAAAAMTCRMELLLLVAGGVFIVETLSDIIQVLYYKKTHRRVFLMAPLHHHYEKKGWSEMKVCTVFWSWGMLLAAISIFLAYLCF
ncbi:MAG: phospho-N-acetylmuramoyl-pentapeptide-transferase [Allobaculum sp.]